MFFDPDAPVTPFRRAVAEMFGGQPAVAGTPLDRSLWSSRLQGGGVFRVDAVHEWAWDLELGVHGLADLLLTFNGWSAEQVAHAVSVAERLGGTVTESYRTIAYVCRAAA